MNVIIVVLTSLLLLFSSPTARAQADGFVVPAMTSPVVDQAGILSRSGLERVEGLIRSLHSSGGSQLAVLTVPSLNGLSIEEASIKVVDQWKLGDKERDDGILLMIAPQDRRMRIEVGQGKEGDLPDAWARRIISEVIGPRFRNADYDQGILLGVAAIIQRTDPQFDLSAAGASMPKMRRSRAVAGGGSAWSFISLFLLLVVISRIIRGVRSGVRTPLSSGFRTGGSGYYGGGFGGGHSGGSGFGGGFGGGYSGGGGGFSGGGSSGSW